jgi:diguanylate cyclase (GGDEF)-like protein/PAS domain S-box-containing protein
MTKASRLLIVDDDEMNRDMLARRLERAGFCVSAVGGGQEALDWLAGAGADLVLLDIQMPGIDGLQALKAIRQRYGQGLPVIMVTARSETDAIVQAFEEGANDHLTKPIDFPVALARIRTQLSRQEAEDALRRSEERYALAARATNDGLWDWDLVEGVVYFSPRWKAMLGCDDGEVGTDPDEWFSRVHPDDVGRVKEAIAAHLDGRTAVFEAEHRMRRAEGDYRWIHSRGLAIRDREGKPYRLAGSQSDITEGKVADALTGLPNRLLFMDRLEHALKRARRRPEYRFAVLFLDLDRFKDVNDSMGHLAGDELLVAVAKRLESSVRATDTVGRIGAVHTVARFGGDEFTVLVEDLRQPVDAVLVAERLLAELVRPFTVAGHEVFTTASIGIVSDTRGYERGEELLRDADTAMYRAKEHGRARHETFDGAMRELVVQRVRLETELQRAVECEEFAAHYQPIVLLHDGRLAGFEALVRWRHSERGMLAPSCFMTAAEETGLIVPIGQGLLREVCAQLESWQRRTPGRTPPLWVSVNVCSREFTQPGFIEQVEREIRAARIAPGSLRLEITESLLVESSEATTAKLTRLRDLNIPVGLDDFGTGYSSLSYLHRFPVSTLKIDRSFVSAENGNVKNREIVRAIVTLAHNLGIEVVAEGVETPAQAHELRTIGCEYAQGYFFARPLAPEAAGQLVAADTDWAPPSWPREGGQAAAPVG